MKSDNPSALETSESSTVSALLIVTQEIAARRPNFDLRLKLYSRPSLRRDIFVSSRGRVWLFARMLRSVVW
jgi:hypothetical protein